MVSRSRVAMFWILLLFQLIYSTFGQTRGGNSNGQPCRFPFIYKGTVYSNCITKDYKRLWCATTANYDIDKLWGDCESLTDDLLSAEDTISLPTFVLSTEDNITKREGEDVRLECKIRNLYGKKVSWQKKGAAYPLTIGRYSFLDDRKYIAEMVDSSHWNLYIENVSAEDSGTYQCRITTRTMLLVRDVQLMVEPSEETKRRHNKSQTYPPDQPIKVSVTQGDSFQLNCSSPNIARVGRGAVMYEDSLVWTKDKNEVQSIPKSGVRITNHVRAHTVLSALTVEEARIEHMGLYVCTSSTKTLYKYWVQVHNRNVNMSRDQPLVILSSTDATATARLPKSIERMLQNRPGNNSNRPDSLSFPFILVSSMVIILTQCNLTQ